MAMGYELKNRNPRRRKRTIAARHRGGAQKMAADIDQIRLRPLIRTPLSPITSDERGEAIDIERKMKTEPVTRNCNSIKSVNLVDLLTLFFFFLRRIKRIKSRISSFEISRTHRASIGQDRYQSPILLKNQPFVTKLFPSRALLLAERFFPFHCPFSKRRREIYR